MNKLIWRIRFTIYGQRRTRWGWRLWWDWSGADFGEFYEDCTPQEVADEEICAACA